MAEKDNGVTEKTEIPVEDTGKETKKQDVITSEPPVQAPVQSPAEESLPLAQPPAQAGPLTVDEIQKNSEEEDRKTMRVLQVIQHVGTQRIEIHPVQNINFRSDIIGVLIQALNNIQNEDMMRNDAALLKEAVAMIKREEKKG